LRNVRASTPVLLPCYIDVVMKKSWISLNEGVDITNLTNPMIYYYLKKKNDEG
jgi:hypothetical protein